jgi:hypothetical protein
MIDEQDDGLACARLMAGDPSPERNSHAAGALARGTRALYSRENSCRKGSFRE